MKHIVVMTALLLSGSALAQETAVYRLTFALHEIENGKSAGTRNYTMLIGSQSNAKLSAGTKLPVRSGPAANQQYTYVDVGVSVHAYVQERGSQLLLNAGIELSNLGAGRENAGQPPRIEQLRADINTVIPLAQATSIATLDYPAGPKHYEIDVTASKVK